MASIKKNLAYNFALSASQLLLPLVSIPYIAHVLHPDGIGRVSFTDSLTYYFISIAEFGIVVYGMREVARIRSDKKALAKLVSELLALHVLSSMIAILIYGIITFLLWQKIQDTRLILLGLSFLFANAFACEWYYYGTEKFRYIATRSILTRLAGLAAILLLIKRSDQYYLYYAIIVGTAFVNILFNITTLFRELPVSFRNPEWKKHISKTWITYCISLLYSISIMLDNVLLGIVSAVSFVAFYSFAIKLVRLSASALTDTLLVFFPQAVALLHGQQKEKFQQAILRNIQLLTLFSIPIGVGLFFLSDAFTTVFFGPAFHRVSVNLKILAVVPFLKCYNLFLSKQVLITYDRERLYRKSLVIAGIVFIVATLMLSFFFHDVGASCAMVIYEASLLGFNYYFVRKTDRELIVFDWKTLLQSLAGAALFIPLVELGKRWMGTDWLTLVLTITFAAGIYILTQAYIFKNDLMVNLRKSGIRLLTQSFQTRDQA